MDRKCLMDSSGPFRAINRPTSSSSDIPHATQDGKWRFSNEPQKNLNLSGVCLAAEGFTNDPVYSFLTENSSKVQRLNIRRLFKEVFCACTSAGRLAKSQFGRRNLLLKQATLVKVDALFGDCITFVTDALTFVTEVCLHILIAAVIHAGAQAQKQLTHSHASTEPPRKVFYRHRIYYTLNK